MVAAGDKIFHSLHGVGTVLSVEEKVVLGQTTRFSVSSFGDEGLKIMINLNKKERMVRPLVEDEQIGDILEHLSSWDALLPTKAPTRYSMNMGKLKSGDVFAMCEVIKGLTALSETRKLTPKDQTMLETSRKNLAQELSVVRDVQLDQMEELIDCTCRNGD